MEATADKFITIEKYKNAVQRQTVYEMRALDQKMIERGQQEPIKVNRKMWILDGYSRHELLEARGIPIKYEFRDFPTEEDELNYVVETNVMRRHMNPFQRVETMYNLYQTKKHKINDDYKKSYIDIINAIKNKHIDVESISIETKKEQVTIRNTLVKMVEDYYLTRNEIVGDKNHKKFIYSLMPKAEELLTKKPNIVTTSYIGGIIGCDRTTVDKILKIIPLIDEDTKQKLRNNTLSISKALEMVVGVKSRVGEKKTNCWGKNSRIQCPSCKNIAPKKEYVVVK